ncbi:MAG: hypothetical protein IKC91_03400 [Clostridia bacterium]|nr:hypothetical protein [Clostridia bacterium]
MKKLKFLTAALCGAVMSFSAFAFTACAPGNGSSSSGSSAGGSDSVGGSSGSSITITADTDPDTIVSEVLNQAQWKAALQASNTDNFSVKIFMQVERPDGGFETEGETKLGQTMISTKGETNYDGSIQKQEDVVMEGENEKIYALSYDATTQSWVEVESLERYSGITYEEYREYFCSQYICGFVAIEDAYAQFSYDQELKAYVAQGLTVTVSTQTIASGESGGLEIKEITQEQNYEKFIIKFVNGKACYVYTQFNLPGMNGSQKTEMLYYDYGTTQVTMPEIAD